MSQTHQPPAGEDQSLELGLLLGQRRSLTLMSGHCTAAHAEILRKIRDEKRFLAVTTSWEKYCGPHLKISRRHADNLISYLNEFGPLYFQLNTLVGISPEQYRQIEPCIRENALHVGNQVLSLIPANTPQLAEAVTHLLRAPHPRPRQQPPIAPTCLQAKLDRLESRGRELAAEFETLINSRISLHDRDRVLDTLRSLRILYGSLEPLPD